MRSSLPMIPRLMPALVVVLGIAGCTAEHFPLRGELDRRQWTVRSCNSGETYRVIFTSGQYIGFHRRIESQLKPDEPVVMAFEADDLGGEWWGISSRHVVGIWPPVVVERGTCADTHGEVKY